MNVDVECTVSDLRCHDSIFAPCIMVAEDRRVGRYDRAIFSHCR